MKLTEHQSRSLSRRLERLMTEHKTSDILDYMEDIAIEQSKEACDFWDDIASILGEARYDVQNVESDPEFPG